MSPTERPVVAVSAAVVRDGRLLLVRRARPPHAGRLALPGGKVEAGETLHQAVVRELREETGLEGVPRELVTALDVFDREADGRLRSHYVLLVIRVSVLPGSAVPGDDALAVEWRDLAELEAAGEEVTAGSREVAARVLADPGTTKSR